MLKEGNIIELKKGHRIFTNIPKHFVCADRRGCFDLIRSVVTIDDQFDYFEGEYVVYKTTYDGGGAEGDPHDTHINGHHAFCEQLKNPDIKVDFYQSGGFAAEIKDIEVIRNASRRWVDK